MQIFKYIEFLLPKHNCVIIPDFGGFVVNAESASLNTEGQFVAPAYSLIFNQALKYNDGLLANFISETENICYDMACAKIKETVKEIKSTLSLLGILDCGNLGTFRFTQDENIAFTASNRMIYPSFFGLTHIGLRPLHTLETQYQAPKKRPLVKYIVSGVAAAAIAALLYASPISIDLIRGNIQQAGFLDSFRSSTTFASSAKAIHYGSISPFISQVTASANDSAQDKGVTIAELPPIEKITETTEAQLPNRTYYIVIGGDESKAQAYRSLEKIKQANFSQANIVEGTSRYRIYVASFSDKKEAERFLDIFRLEYPEYATAWLYSQRNS